MFQGKLGNETISDYIHNNHYQDINEYHFIHLMNMMLPLFKGLNIMQKKNIIHNDIKGGNIAERPPETLYDGTMSRIDNKESLSNITDKGLKAGFFTALGEKANTGMSLESNNKDPKIKI